MISLSFHGAARTVTGSRHIVTVNDQKVLLDCGLFQGRRTDTYQNNLHFSFNPEEMDSVVLSHSHIDHIGNVPNLVKQGFHGDIHATLASVDLVSIMLLDSAHIQESDVTFVNKIRRKKGQPPVEPLYQREDIPPVTELLNGHNYNRWFSITKDIKGILRDAGHVLGSAITVLKCRDNDREVSICYTGDLGRKNLPIIRDPQTVDDAEILIIESTYGNRLHGEFEDVKEKLAGIINDAVARRGKIFIPAFALERTQEIVYTLHQLKLEKRIPDIPVFVDSPLAIDATNIFRMHPECFDKETNEFLRKVDDPFGFSKLTYTRTAEESMKLNDIKDPIIVLAGSGMVESGRILHHLKNNIENPLNTILIVGWQGENTLGRKISEKWPKVNIFGEAYELKAHVEVFDEFSAHADRDDLIEWIFKCKECWRKVFIVHGEETASLSFAQTLKDAGIPEVIVPELNQSFIL